MAGFIGRTNFLDGTVQGDRIVFPGFSVPLAAAPEARALTGAASFSVRPQTIALHAFAPAAADGGWWVEGRIAERAYLGDYWEYGVRPTGSEARLRVSTPPTVVHEVNDPVWLEIDPARLARIPPPGPAD